MSIKLIGRTLGDFQIKEQIGAGSMAKVFLAKQNSLGRSVALKVLEEGIFTPGDNIKRFFREAEALARLEHPHIVPVYAAGEEGLYYFFAMRRIKGGTLADALKKGIKVKQALVWGRQIAMALAYAHNNGIIHRDLKPTNILLQDNVAFLSDFGLARLRDCSTITEKGFALGTPKYMAPEQTLGEEAKPATDCFALGVIIYQMLTGTHPFENEKDKTLQRHQRRTALFNRIKNTQFIPASEKVHDLPDEIDQIIRRALKKDLNQRYMNGAEFLRDLEEFVKISELVDRVVKVDPTDEDGTQSSSRTETLRKISGANLVPDSGLIISGVKKFRDEASSTVPSDAAADPYEIKPLFCIGRYEILGEIGHGGQGLVYVAHDPVLDRKVALKVLQSRRKEDSQLVKMFWNEARIAARLNHPHIISIFDFGVEANAPYLTMPLIEGPSLDQLLDLGHPLPLRFSMQVLYQIGQALSFAHRLGVIHLDVKPGNILIRRGTTGELDEDENRNLLAFRELPDGTLEEILKLPDPFFLLTDFTMAHIRYATSQMAMSLKGKKSKERRSSHPGGTVAYASPEQILGELDKIGPGSDVFSLGIVFYEMLTGKKLFSRGNTIVSRELILDGNFPLPSTVQPNVPKDIDELCAWMLKRNPEERMQTIDELLARVLLLLPAVGVA